MIHRLGLVVLASIALAAATACASTDDNAPISERAARGAAAGVPPGSNDSATVRGGISSPTGP